MAFRDILVRVDGGPRSALRREVAARLAVRHGARLTGLFVFDTALPFSH